MPSLQDPMPTNAELSLEAGLVALKQGNYPLAIAKLTPVASSQENPTTNLQARVGLVMAYARTGQIRKATVLCQTLTESENTQVKEWAKLALTHLTKSQKSSKAKSAGRVNSPSQHQPKKTAGETTVPSVGLMNTVVSSVKYGNRTVTPSSHTPNKWSADIPTPSSSIYWRQGKRAKVWQPLKKPNSIPLDLLALGTLAALYWVLTAVVKIISGIINYTLVQLPYLEPLQFLYLNPASFVLMFVLLMMGLSPWLLDWLLTKYYGQGELSKDVLHNHSRETIRVLKRYSQQRSWHIPKLRILPIPAPVALTYGNLARNARIVVSEGLLEQLAEDEIATIYAAQLGHIAQWNLAVMSLVLLLSLPIYHLYQQISIWGNRQSEGIWYKPITILASVVYGFWCLLTGISLWLSRVRHYYSDIYSTEITGNPNALTRALLKMAVGIAVDIQKTEQTSWQLESLNLLLPVGYQQSVCLGSIAGQMPFESILMWDTCHPYGRWFAINNSHPLMGDRIQRLSQIARQWHIDPEIHLTRQQTAQVKFQSFLLHIAPFVGIPLGCVFAGLIWLTWQTAFTLRLLNLKWIYDDGKFVIGSLLIGFSIGMVCRMNSFFPDIKTTNVGNEQSLPHLLAHPSALPIDGISVQLVGKLLGRRGAGNCLGQDLILQCGTGLVKLHHISLGQSVNPQDFIGRQIIVTGWFRRGATPWIDIHTVQTQTGKTIYSPHPIWSTAVAVAAQAWGAYIFLTG